MRTWPRGRNADYVTRVIKAAQAARWTQVIHAIRAAADKVLSWLWSTPACVWAVITALSSAFESQRAHRHAAQWPTGPTSQVIASLRGNNLC